jgi:UDP-glucose 4-epimerase
MVIGGSGFIGGRVVEILTENNVHTLSYDILNSYPMDEKTRWIRADILELPAIERLFFEYDVEAIIHLVGVPSIGYCEKNPHFSFQLNVLSVQNALEAMRKTDAKKIVFASSAAVYGYSSENPVRETDLTNPTTIYGHHKFIAEEAIKAYCNSYGLNYAILRLFNVYGGDPHIGKDVISIFIRRALKGESILVEGPRKFRDFVHVNDVAQVFKEVVTSNVSKVTLNVGTGVMMTLQEIAEITRECFDDVNVKYEKAHDDGTGLLADVTLARKIFNFSPEDPKHGIREHIVSYAPPKTKS